MIGYLKGDVLRIRKDHCLLATAGGVGYDVQATAGTLGRLEQGVEAELFVHTVVREDALELYGFATLSERDAFAELLGVSKLGPKTALAILSTFMPKELARIAHTEDTTALTRVSGIGPKSAKRIMWELKDKLAAWEGDTVSGTAQTTHQAKGGSVYGDALSGLCGLGYDEGEVRPVLGEILEQEPDLDVGETIRACLKRLARHTQ
ncbi:MAG: Holliday junction branch migration protein RuvA [Desulfohalobium sp.]